MVRGVAKAMFASYFPKYFSREPGAIKVYSKLNLEIPKYSTFNVQTFLNQISEYLIDKSKASPP